MTTDLPIAAVLPELLASLRARPNCILQAPPGTGKTTGVPLALLGEAWAQGQKILMLEPRRLAARAAAARMASVLGEVVGETCGYRIRLDSKVGKRTRIEVVTDGIFTRLIQDDPGLEGVAAILFDEFHERRLETDLGLALSLEAQATLRPELRLLVMSATLEPGRLATLLDAPIVSAAARAFPVEIRHLPVPVPGRLAAAVADAIGLALAEPGGILVFLPGQREIRDTERELGQRRLPAGSLVLPLHGELATTAQERALAPPPAGCRKIVLATAIAETSLTIPDVRLVIDAGLSRVSRYDPRSGLSRLETEKVTLAGATQRTGRAGRVAPGICWRLWPRAAEGALRAYPLPEIASADLAPLALELARWGHADLSGMAFLDAPDAAAFAVARNLLTDLEALDAQGRLTPHGAKLGQLGQHPRLAHMLLKAREQGEAPLAAAIAALLGEPDLARDARDSDLRSRIELLLAPARAGKAADAARRALEIAKRLVRLAGASWSPPLPARAGAILALAYPDRIAQARGEAGRFLLSGGGGAWMEPNDPLAGEKFLAVADLDGKRPNARIRLAAPLTTDEIDTALGARIETIDEIAWEPATASVRARRRRRLGALILSETLLPQAPGEATRTALLAGIARTGLACLPWTDEATALRDRIGFLRRLEGKESAWPDMSDAALLADLEGWLGPALDGMRSLADLAKLNLGALLLDRLDWNQRRDLDLLAPMRIAVPSGSNIEIDYEPDPPVLAVKLQEMFGARETPSIAGGRVKLVLHLLSPARRPIQITADLAAFWAGSYKAVRSDLRGRYPRHPWPEDPVAAVPTARAKPRGS